MRLVPKLVYVFMYSCNGKYSLSDRLRFSSKISICETGCWEWRASCYRSGYGQFGILCKKYLAHRASFEMSTGKLASAKVICHTCDNRKCVNPNHLFLGTQQDNIRDMLNKNRQGVQNNHGENNPNSTLTWETVDEIRELYNRKYYTQNQLVEKFGVTQAQISRIIRNKLWYNEKYIRTNFRKGNTRLHLYE